MDTIRLQTHPDGFSNFSSSGSLDHHFIVSGFYNDLIMHSLKDHRLHHAGDCSFFRFRHDHVLRPDDHINLSPCRQIIQTRKLGTTEINFSDTAHMAGVNIALANKVCHEYSIGLVVDLFRCTDLLDLSVRHNDHLV